MNLLQTQVVRFSPNPSQHLNYPKFTVEVGKVYVGDGVGMATIEYSDKWKAVWHPEMHDIIIRADQLGNLKIFAVPRLKDLL